MLLQRTSFTLLTFSIVLIATASLEHAIVKNRVAGIRPPSSAAEASHPFATPLDTVKHVIVSSDSVKSPDDEIQGRTCIWWAHWVAGSDQESFSPGSVTPYTEEEDSTYSLWTKICVVKAAFIKGVVFIGRGALLDADLAFERVIPLLEMNKSTITSTPQFAYWSEQLLAEIAIARTTQDMSDGGDTATYAFRQWAHLACKGTQQSPTTFGHARTPRTRMSVWRAYYHHLSALLQQSHPDAPLHLRSNLVPELRRVETAYENELLRSVQFPKASESNQVIEEWVEQVIANWEVLCGSQWSVKDLGEGGRNTVGRHVIDVLYRAATKSFHSTLVLRRLFQVHKSLADFDLAYKALDTYLELIERGRARAAKSKQPPSGQDDDELVLLTIAEGIEGLCSFGHRQEAEKAYNLSLKLESLLGEIDPTALLAGTEIGTRNGNAGHVPTSVERLSAQSRELIHRALGIGKAVWARWTSFNENRSSMQLEAVAHLRLATSQPIANRQKLKSTYALSLLLAETREIDAAVDAVKEALAQDPTSQSDGHLFERQLICAWHLLSLLLTSRQEFDTAAQGCVAAFEQFPSSSTLFGDEKDSPGSLRTQSEKPSEAGLVDDMECNELQSIIEVRITELALTELMEGPEVAVNSSSDLLLLYSRLFGHLGIGAEEKPQTKASKPPKSSAGTVKSIRESLFRRKGINSTEVFNKPNGTASIQTETTRPRTQATQAPTIRVTDEDEKPSPHKHHLFRHSRESSRHYKKLPPQSNTQSQQSPVTPKRLARPPSRDHNHPPASSAISSQRQSFETSREAPPSSTGTAETAQPHLSPILSAEETPRPSTPPTMGTNTDDELTPTATQPLPAVPHNLASHNEVPAPHGHTTQPPQQDTRLPSKPTSFPPVPRFPRTAAQKHALTILVKIWLIIARLYRRASIFDDSREATDEAAKAALKIESLVASVESSARAFADPGWGGGGKSSDEIWADVYCERGECALAVAMARVEVDEKDKQKNNPAAEPPHLSTQTDPLTHSQAHSQVDSEGVRDAVEMFEQCLMYFPDHPGGIVGLSNVLLDYYERKVELGRKVDDGKARANMQAAMAQRNGLGRGIRVGSVVGQRRGEEANNAITNNTASPFSGNANGTNSNTNTNDRPPLIHRETLFVPTATPDDLLTLDTNLKKTPDNLNRLAARDRAYGLLSTLTKLGTGWDNSEAWFALARAHELGGEIEKAKEMLWWVVELEDSRPLRGWWNVGVGGYVL